jgi:hypothetical protein
MVIVQVVGQLPPAISGVGDYACRLREALAMAARGNVQSPLIACGAALQREISEVQAINLTGGCSVSQLVQAIQDLAPDAVLLNYVGYAYAKRGAPFWLLRAMETLRIQSPSLRLFTMFHELYANGMPWQSSFWISPLQRHIAARLAQLSHQVAVTSFTGRTWLQEQRSPRQAAVVCLPVCSTVGEPVIKPDFADRSSTAVLFNGGGPLREVLCRHSRQIVPALRRSGITTLLQMGSRRGPFGSAHGVTCVDTGPLTGAEISGHLRAARIGMVGYPRPYVTKSSVVAAYLAHGLPTLLVDERGNCQIYSDFGASSSPAAAWPAVLESSALERASTLGYDWYVEHAHSSVHARSWLNAAGEGT